MLSYSIQSPKEKGKKSRQKKADRQNYQSNKRLSISCRLVMQCCSAIVRLTTWNIKKHFFSRLVLKIACSTAVC